MRVDEFISFPQFEEICLKLHKSKKTFLDDVSFHRLVSLAPLSDLSNVLASHLNPSQTHSTPPLLRPESLLSHCAEVLTLFWLQAFLPWSYQISHCCLLSCIIADFSTLHLKFIRTLYSHFSLSYALQHAYKPLRCFVVKCWLILNWSLGSYHGPQLKANLFQGWSLCEIEANNTVKIKQWSMAFYSHFPNSSPLVQIIYGLNWFVLLCEPFQLAATCWAIGHVHIVIHSKGTNKTQSAWSIRSQAKTSNFSFCLFTSDVCLKRVLCTVIQWRLMIFCPLQHSKYCKLEWNVLAESASL